MNQQNSLKQLKLLAAKSDSSYYECWGNIRPCWWCRI